MSARGVGHTKVGQLWRDATTKAKRRFLGVLFINAGIVAFVHWDQYYQSNRMKAGVFQDQKRLRKKLATYGINEKKALYRDLPEYALSKQHQPVRPEDIPELAALGVTSESDYVPGMARPKVDLD
jgi:hypothetical protein